MHVEAFFAKTMERDALLEIVARRLSSSPDEPRRQPNWGLESSYDVWLAKEPKRKVAISPLRDNWIIGVESKEVLDFAMLQTISEELHCTVIACQLAGTIDSWGCACCSAGQLLESKWHENDTDPLNALRAYLQDRGIACDLITFREAVRLRGEGWTIVESHR
jgi:hypothetical protein